MSFSVVGSLAIDYHILQGTVSVTVPSGMVCACTSSGLLDARPCDQPSPPRGWSPPVTGWKRVPARNQAPRKLSQTSSTATTFWTVHTHTGTSLLVCFYVIMHRKSLKIE